MSRLSVTHTTTVTADQIDHLGHLNVRHYWTIAHRGTTALLHGAPTEDPSGPAADIPGVRLRAVHARHHHEQLLGAPLVVRSGVAASDATSATVYAELTNDDTGELAATFWHLLTTDDLDRVPRAARRWWRPEGPSEPVDVPPAGRPRSLGLDADAVAAAPTLHDAAARGLAQRMQRTVTAAECGPDGVLSPVGGPGLVWEGETTDGAQGPGLHDDGDGAVVGWATMEAHLQNRRLPGVGTRVQSFGATVAVADKTTRWVSWVYDLDRGDVLCAFETINLAFDTVARRAVAIPDELRRQAEARLHPDLAAR